MWTWSLRLPETPPAKCSWSLTKRDTRTPEHHLLASEAPVSPPLRSLLLLFLQLFRSLGFKKGVQMESCSSCSLDPFWFFQVLLLFFEMHLQIWVSSTQTCCCVHTSGCISFSSASVLWLPCYREEAGWSDRLVPASSSEFGSPLPQILTSLLQLQPQLRVSLWFTSSSWLCSALLVLSADRSPCSN